MAKKTYKLTETQLVDLIEKTIKEHTEKSKPKLSEQYRTEERMDVRDTFTSTDRRMLSAIYDVLVKGGASGGYKSGRKRALTPLGYSSPLGEE